MTYTGITKEERTCAICKKQMPAGTLVWFDYTKRQGSHLTHYDCWNELKASRPRKPLPKKKDRPKPVSKEDLDPPF